MFFERVKPQTELEPDMWYDDYYFDVRSTTAQFLKDGGDPKKAVNVLRYWADQIEGDGF